MGCNRRNRLLFSVTEYLLPSSGTYSSTDFSAFIRAIDKINLFTKVKCNGFNQSLYT